MAEGDGPKPGEVPSAEALERFDAYIAKQKELLELRKQDSEFIKDNIDLLRIQQEQAKADLDILAQKLDRELKLTQERLEKLKLEKSFLKITILKNMTLLFVFTLGQVVIEMKQLIP